MSPSDTDTEFSIQRKLIFGARVRVPSWPSVVAPAGAAAANDDPAMEHAEAADSSRDELERT